MEEGVLFCRDDHSLVCFPNLLADPYEDGDEDDYEPVTYKVPAGTEIGDAAFDTCKYLSRVVLPAGLKRIPPMLFYECESLYEADIPVIRLGGEDPDAWITVPLLCNTQKHGNLTFRYHIGKQNQKGRETK